MHKDILEWLEAKVPLMVIKAPINSSGPLLIAVRLKYGVCRGEVSVLRRVLYIQLQ